MPVHDFDPPHRFVAGTVGPPGQRTFFLQAREGRRLISVSCEKEALSVLADRVLDVLDDFAGAAGSDASATAYQDDDALDTPIEDDFRVRTIALGWDPARQVVVIEARPTDDDATEGDAEDDDGDDDGDAEGEVARLLNPEVLVGDGLRVTLPPAQARAFARRAQSLIRAGRPPCPFCAGPLDPAGHICPRANGYRR
ncbi:MAG: DUF3090 family protein [Actinomycetales bacterium]|nr:DUF3090 family protein [Actinomycetales bacterium]